MPEENYQKIKLLKIMEILRQETDEEHPINDDKELFRSLYERKAEIEADVGAELDWRELPEKKASRILIKRDVNLTDEQEWPQQFDWVMDKLVKMKKAFKKYI